MSSSILQEQSPPVVLDCRTSTASLEDYISQRASSHQGNPPALSSVDENESTTRPNSQTSLLSDDKILAARRLTSQSFAYPADDDEIFRLSTQTQEGPAAPELEAAAADQGHCPAGDPRVPSSHNAQSSRVPSTTRVTTTTSRASSTLHYDDYRAEVGELVSLHLSLPKKFDATIAVPECTLLSQQDPFLFYRIPVGYGLWDAACALAVCVGERWEEIVVGGESGGKGGPQRPSRVLELGCGAAPLPALMARHCMGDPPSQAEVSAESEVVVSDLLPDLVALAEKNMESSPLQENITQIATRGVVYSFGDEDTSCFGQDFSAEGKPTTFDLILGADIVYLPRPVLLQLKASLNLLTHASSRVVLSHARRLDEEIDWFFSDEVLGETFRVVWRGTDDSIDRWRKYGRVAHNARPGAGEVIDVVALERK